MGIPLLVNNLIKIDLWVRGLMARKGIVLVKVHLDMSVNREVMEEQLMYKLT